MTKEELKQEIERLPDEAVEQVYVFVCQIFPKQPHKKPLRSFKLKGQFDHIRLREIAYE